MAGTVDIIKGGTSIAKKTGRAVPAKKIPGDVGPKTGSVNSVGGVKIQGTVLPGFTVRTTSTIEADYAEKATLAAAGDIILNRGSVLSFIQTNGKVETEKGKLLGGVCQAQNGIDAADLGSATGGYTEISFGQNYLVKARISEIETKIAKTEKSLGAIETLIHAGSGNPKALEEARGEKIRALKLIQKMKFRVFCLEEQFEEHCDSEVRIRGTVYPGVVIESHGRQYKVKNARQGVVFYFDRESGKILEKPITPENHKIAEE